MRARSVGCRSGTDSSLSLPMIDSRPTVSPPEPSVRELFDRALALDADGRRALLDAECAGRPALRARIVDLLAAASSACAVLDVGLPELAAPLFEGASAAAGGPAVGPYRLCRELGRGGMGTVWFAERSSGDFQQQVALKLIRGDAASGEAESRFLREREILAGLRHPNIAVLVDGGITADRRLWYAMEYIEGDTLLAWCNARRLGIAERVRLLLPICSAVHHAHQNLVVHRDLKPANILVDRHGVPKLLDFGIAKPLIADAHGETDAEARLMTPEYAAPEQITGAAITTATDVHALGVILFELATGARPFRAVDGLFALQKEIVEAVPPSLSAAYVRDDAGARRPREIEAANARGLDPRDWRRCLRGDLDRIVGRCLAKAPEARYPSAAALAVDLEAWLAGRPVSAADDGYSYRARRFVRRHAAVVAIAAAATLALLVATAVSLYEARQARQALAEAEQRARAARAAADMMGHLLNPTQFRARGGRPAPATSLLTELEQSNAFYLDEFPDSRAEVEVRLARAWRAAGNIDAAAAAYARLFALQAQRRPDPILASLNRLEAAELEVRRGDAAAAERYLAAVEPATVSGPNADVFRRSALVLRARLALLAGDPASAERLLDAALPLSITPSGARGMHYAESRWWQAAAAAAAGRPDIATERFVDSAVTWSGDPMALRDIVELDPELPLQLIDALLPPGRARPLAEAWRAAWARRLAPDDARLARLDRHLAAPGRTDGSSPAALTEARLITGMVLFQSALAIRPESHLEWIRREQVRPEQPVETRPSGSISDTRARDMTGLALDEAPARRCPSERSRAGAGRTPPESTRRVVARPPARAARRSVAR